jgi:hypothetical protein
MSFDKTYKEYVSRLIPHPEPLIDDPQKGSGHSDISDDDVEDVKGGNAELEGEVSREELERKHKEELEKEYSEMYESSESFKKFISEAKDFPTPDEVTEYFDDIARLLNDERLMSWAKFTDRDSNINSVKALKTAIKALKTAIKAFNDFYGEMLKVDEEYSEMYESSDSEKSNISEAKEFPTSVEATEHFDQIESLLNDERLMAWAKLTDRDYSTKSVKILKTTIKYFNDFYDEMNKADDY